MTKLDDAMLHRNAIEVVGGGGNTTIAELARQLTRLIDAVHEAATGGGSPDLGALNARVDTLQIGLKNDLDTLSRVASTLAQYKDRIDFLDHASRVQDASIVSMLVRMDALENSVRNIVEQYVKPQVMNKVAASIQSNQS